jgi:hypothetical protein
MVEMLQNAAIHMTFDQGAWKGIKSIVEKFHEYPAITYKRYAEGLFSSWNKGKPNPVFPFLLEQADQGDLEEVKETREYWNNPDFSKAINGAMKTTPLTGMRLSRKRKS